METQLQPPISAVSIVGMGERGVSLISGLAGMYYVLTHRPNLKIGLPWSWMPGT